MKTQQNSQAGLIGWKQIYRLSAVLLSCFLAHDASAADLPLKSGDRLVFGGDSQEDLSMCPHYISSYLILRNPTLMLHCQTEARSGLNLEGWLDPSGPSYSHYSRRVASYQPNYFSIANSDNGMFTKDRHKAAMTSLVFDYAIAQGATPIMYGNPPCCSPSGDALAGQWDDADQEIALSVTPPLLYHKTWWALMPKWTECKTFTVDSTTDTFTSPGHGFANGQPVIFLLSANPVGPTGISTNVRYYLRDVTTDTFKVSTTVGGAPVDILTNGSGTNYVSNTWPRERRDDHQNDDHTGMSGNIAFAWTLITGLGWSSDVSQAVIDGNAATLTSQNSCTVTGVSANANGGVDFTRLDSRLPWAIDEAGRAGAVFLYPAIQGWQNYSLTVTGLNAGNYDVLCDGELIAITTDVALAAGWNMADLTCGPVWRQGQEVLGRIRDMHCRSRTYPFAPLPTSIGKIGVEKYRGAVDNGYQTLGLSGAALIANSAVQAALHRNLRPVTSVDPTSDIITQPGHGYQNGQKLRVSSTDTLPAPLMADTDYFVRDYESVSYRLAASVGGPAIDITTPGTGTMSVYTMDNIDDLDALIHVAAQPVAHAYSVRLHTGPLSSTAAVNLGNLTQSYDGTPKAATATTAPANLTVAITYNGLTTAPTAAGSYPVVGTISDPYYIGAASDTLVIAPAAATVTLGSLAATYDGTAKSATATTTPAGLSVAITYNGSAAAPTTAGSYTVVGTINDPNYTGSATGTLVISGGLTATITLGGLAQTYDGIAKSATATTSPAGLAVTFTYNGSATAPTAPGSYTVVGTIIDPNYTGSATGTLVISDGTAKTPATVTLGNLTATFDGTAKSATASTSPAGLTVTFTYNGSTTAPTAVGSYTVVGTISDANYTGSATGTLVISSSTNKIPAVVTLGNLTNTYSGTAKSATAATNPGGLAVAMTYNGSTTPPIIVGNYSVVGTVNDPNYTGSATGTLVIAKASATVTLGSLTATYDGTQKKATATTNPAGLALIFTYNGSTTAPTAAGSYAVVCTISDAHYAGSATGTLVISSTTKTPATVTLGNLAATYDGTAKSATATTSPAGLTVAFTYNGSATVPTSAGSYTVVGTINDPNYTGSATGTLVVSAGTATVTLGGLAATYDGTAKSVTATTVPAGLTVAFTYNGSATAPTAAGSYAVVGTINDPNYTGSATGTLVIASGTAKTAATVTLANLTRTYDGSPKMAYATTNPPDLAVTFTYNGNSLAPAAVGSYAVVATISDATYAGSATGTFVIAPSTTTGYVPPWGIPAPAFGINEQPVQPAAWPGAVATGSYYIDNTSPQATDTNNPYGYPNKPRLTIPTTLTVQAGTLVEIHGGPYLASATAYAWRVISSTTSRPTAQAPAFIRGVGQPVIGLSQAAIDANVAARIECGNVIGAGLHYTIFDGLHFVRMQLGIDGWDCQYIAIRNCEANGHYCVPLNVNPPGDKVVNGVTYQGHIHDVVFYNNLIHDTAYWNNSTQDWDFHGTSVATFGRTYPTDLYNVWVLDSTYYHCSGDSVQVNGNTAGNAALHHIYIGGNTAWENRQTGFWCKQASDVVMSQNKVHTMDVQGTGLTGTGMGSQYGADRLWFLFNEIYDCGFGFRQSDTVGADGRDVYYIGNYIHDLRQYSNANHWGSPQGWGISLWSGSLNRHIVGNTIVNVFGGIETIQPGPVYAQNNIIYNLLPSLYPDVFGTYRNHIECNPSGDGVNVDYTTCLFYGASGGASQQARINWRGAPYTTLASAQAATGKFANCIEADPLLGFDVNQTTSSVRLRANSPAINAGATSDVYQKFQDLYGLDIRKGFSLDRRVQNLRPGWNIGAYQSTSVPPPNTAPSETPLK